VDESPRAPEWLEAANFHATVARLLSTVVHQVNNALQTIGGHAELLRTEPGVSVTTKRRAETIAAVTDRVAALLADVQVLARPQDELRLIDLRAVVDQALALRQYGLGRAKIEARVDSSGSTTVRGQLHALLQVVLNLVLNAEQALAGGAGGRIAATITGMPGQVVLEIVDTGGGYAPAAVNETPGPGGALGLGLSVSRAIVARHGGSVAVDAPTTAGTRVRVILPAVREGDTASD